MNRPKPPQPGAGLKMGGAPDYDDSANGSKPPATTPPAEEPRTAADADGEAWITVRTRNGGGEIQKGMLQARTEEKNGKTAGKAADVSDKAVDARNKHEIPTSPDSAARASEEFATSPHRTLPQKDC